MTTDVDTGGSNDEAASDARDAIAELETLERSQKSASPLMEPFALSSGVGMPSHQAQSPSALGPEAGPIQKAKTLEDLYSNHPEIGSGSKFIRVERKEPPFDHGVRISGIQGEDIKTQISMGEFMSKYGGGVYHLHVIGRTRGFDASGSVNLKTIETMRIEVPGMPNLESVPGFLSKESRGGNMPGYSSTGDSTLAQRALELSHQDRQQLADRERKLQDQMLAQKMNGGWGPDVLQKIDEASAGRASEVRQSMKETTDQLRSEVGRLTGVLERKDGELEKLRKELFEVQATAATKLREQETTLVSGLRERYETEKSERQQRFDAELSRVKDEQARLTERMQTEHTRTVTEMIERHGRERRDYESAQERDRARLVETSDRREKQIADDARSRDEAQRSMYESRLTEMARGYESRLSEADRAHKREIDQIKDARERELTSIQTTEQAKVVFAEKSAEMTSRAMENELVRTRSELDSQKIEAEALRREKYKPLVDQVREAQEIVMLTGGVPNEKDEGDWKSQLFGLIREVGGEGLRTIQEMRKNPPPMMRPQQQQAMHPGMQRPAVGPQAQQQQAQMQMRPRAQMQRPMAPPPMWGTAPMSPPDPSAPPPVPNPGWTPMAAPQPPPVFPGEAVAAMPRGPSPATVPSDEPGPSGNMASPFDASAQQPPPPPAQQQQAQRAPGALNPLGGLGEDELRNYVNQFASGLNAAILVKMDPREFAERFIGAAGEANVRQIVHSVAPDQVVDVVVKAPGGADTAIGTRSGRAFVRDLWKACEERLG